MAEAVRRLDEGVQGPSWDLSAEYTAPDAPEIDVDLGELDRLLGEIDTQNQILLPALPGAAELRVANAEPAIAAARRVYEISEQAAALLRNPLTYAACLLSVDAQDERAQALQGRLQSHQKRYSELLEPWSQFLDLVTDEVIDAYLADPAVAPSAFLVRHGRERRHELLSLEEETLGNALAMDGIHAWGDLYDQLSGTTSCEVLVGNELKTMGLAQAGGLMQKPDDRLRHAAWQGVNKAWEKQEESCAAAINAIAGWRLEMGRRRSKKKPVHFLDAPVHLNRIRRSTLDAMIDSAEQAAPLARRAAKAMARAYRKEKIGPWDVRAPAPSLGGKDTPVPFDQGVELIANAYGEVHPEMADFVRMMAKNRWIEGTVTPRKRPGAYCTGFAKSRTSRIYMTYTGSASDVITLAHELGHAFHSWVMRDLPESQRSYGMSLAETASTFGETTVRDALMRRAESPAQRFEIMWQDVESLPSFLLNIPARFTFEKAFYEKRDARPLRPAELKALMSAAWQHWYGEALAEPDPMFWASKLHFYISGLSFYNFPYLFGYLFSLGLYLRKDDFGAEFYPRYVALLRDTGRMTAEALAEQHLGLKIDGPEFWSETIARLEPRVKAFETLVTELVPA